LFNAAEEELQM